jgi:hypothetical protein
MFNKPWVGRTLISILVLVVLAAAGYAIYQIGYTRGVLATGEGIPAYAFGCFNFMDDEGQTMPFQDRRGIMFHNFYPGRFPGSRTSGIRGFVSPFSLIFRLIVFGGVLWALYAITRGIFRGRGWQLTFSKTPDEAISVGDEKIEQGDS